MIHSDELFRKTNTHRLLLHTHIPIQMNALVHLAEVFLGCKGWQAGEAK